MLMNVRNSIISQALSDIIRFSHNHEFKYKCFDYMEVSNCNELQKRIEVSLEQKGRLFIKLPIKDNAQEINPPQVQENSNSTKSDLDIFRDQLIDVNDNVNDKDTIETVINQSNENLVNTIDVNDLNEIEEYIFSKYDSPDNFLWEESAETIEIKHSQKDYNAKEEINLLESKNVENKVNMYCIDNLYQQLLVTNNSESLIHVDKFQQSKKNQQYSISTNLSSETPDIKSSTISEIHNFDLRDPDITQLGSSNLPFITSQDVAVFLESIKMNYNPEIDTKDVQIETKDVQDNKLPLPDENTRLNESNNQEVNMEQLINKIDQNSDKKMVDSKLNDEWSDMEANLKDKDEWSIISSQDLEEWLISSDNDQFNSTCSSSDFYHYQDSCNEIINNIAESKPNYESDYYWSDDQADNCKNLNRISQENVVNFMNIDLIWSQP